MFILSGVQTSQEEQLWYKHPKRNSTTYNTFKSVNTFDVALSQHRRKSLIVHNFCETVTLHLHVNLLIFPLLIILTMTVWTQAALQIRFGCYLMTIILTILVNQLILWVALYQAQQLFYEELQLVHGGGSVWGDWFTSG